MTPDKYREVAAEILPVFCPEPCDCAPCKELNESKLAKVRMVLEALCAEVAEALEAENQRLREALEEVKTEAKRYAAIAQGDDDDKFWDLIDIAADALTHPQGKDS